MTAPRAPAVGPLGRKILTVTLSALGGLVVFSVVAAGLRLMGSRCGLLCQPDAAAFLGLLAGLVGGLAAEWDSSA